MAQHNKYYDFHWCSALCEQPLLSAVVLHLPDSDAAYATDLSINSYGSLPAATYSTDSQRSATTLVLPLSMRRQMALGSTPRPGLKWASVMYQHQDIVLCKKQLDRNSIAGLGVSFMCSESLRFVAAIKTGAAVHLYSMLHTISMHYCSYCLTCRVVM